MRKKHKAKLTISRPSYHQDKKIISIQVTDSVSSVRFLNIEIGLEDFAECVTGMSFVECEMVVRDIEKVGKIKESMDIEFEIPKPSYIITRNELEWLAKNATPFGWECSLYFGSQNSFYSVDGKDYARTTAHRWIDQ